MPVSLSPLQHGFDSIEEAYLDFNNSYFVILKECSSFRCVLCITLSTSLHVQC